MKYLSLFLLLTAYNGKSYGQTGSSVETFNPGIVKIRDTTLGTSPDTPKVKYLDQKMVINLIDRKFSYITSGDSKSQIGNFAAVDLTKPILNLNLSGAGKNGIVYTVTATGSIKDGIGSLFSNSRLNNDVSLQGKLSFLGPGTQKIGSDKLQINKFQNDTLLISQTYRTQVVMAVNTFRLHELRTQQIEKQINIIQGQLAKPNADTLKLKVDLLQKIDTLNAIKISLNTVYKKSLINYLDELNKGKGDQIKAIEDQFTLKAFKLNWFSISYKVANSIFSLFNPDLAFDQQVSKNHYLSHTAGFDFNYYNFDVLPYHTRYLRAGLGFFIKDNLSDLNSLELNEKSEYGPSAGLRNAIKKYNAYVDINDYKKDLKGIRIDVDFYQFLFKNNLMAIHFFPNAIYANRILPQYDAGLGVLFSLKDKKDDTGKAIINAELYCNFRDITDTKNKGTQFINRNDIGIRFALPINFVNP